MEVTILLFSCRRCAPVTSISVVSRPDRHRHAVPSLWYVGGVEKARKAEPLCNSVRQMGQVLVQVLKIRSQLSMGKRAGASFIPTSLSTCFGSIIKIKYGALRSKVNTVIGRFIFISTQRKQYYVLLPCMCRASNIVVGVEINQLTGKASTAASTRPIGPKVLIIRALSPLILIYC